MSDERLILTAFITVQPGSEEQVEAHIHDVVGPTRAEEGCLQYEFHRSSADPSQYFAYEQWRSPAALEAHFKEPHLQAFVKAIGPYVVGTIDMRKYTLLSKG